MVFKDNTKMRKLLESTPNDRAKTSGSYNELQEFQRLCRQTVLATDARESIFVAEYLMMIMHSPMEDIQRLACDSEINEADELYLTVLNWSNGRKARVASLHTGQVLRLAANFPENQLRDFYAICHYQATLILWTLGLTSSLAACSDNAENRIVLNAESNELAHKFISTGQGVPGIVDRISSPGSNHVGEIFSPLVSTVMTTSIAASTLKSNFNTPTGKLPQLVEKLGTFILYLGKSGSKSSV